jgi:hypothetical protein
MRREEKRTAKEKKLAVVEVINKGVAERSVGSTIKSVFTAATQV